MNASAATATLIGSSHVVPPQTTIAATSSQIYQQQQASTSDVMVTPSSSTSVRKRSFFESSEPQLTDPSFRTSCKKRFLQIRQNNQEAFMQTPQQRSIDVLRDVVHDELFRIRDNMYQNKNQNQQQWHDQARTELLVATNHGEMNLDANDDCGGTAMAGYCNHGRPKELQSPKVHAFPRANHYVDDEELYDLLLEMEHELNDTIALTGNHPEAYNVQTQKDLPLATESSVKMMTDWEEEMYFMSTQQHDDNDDAVQEQIMEYYNQD